MKALLLAAALLLGADGEAPSTPQYGVVSEPALLARRLVAGRDFPHDGETLCVIAWATDNHHLAMATSSMDLCRAPIGTPAVVTYQVRERGLVVISAVLMAGLGA